MVISHDHTHQKRKAQGSLDFNVKQKGRKNGWNTSVALCLMEVQPIAVKIDGIRDKGKGYS
jgi:hypothetical protein